MAGATARRMLMEAAAKIPHPYAVHLPPSTVRLKVESVHVQHNGVELELDGAVFQKDGIKEQLDSVEVELDSIEVQFDSVRGQLDAVGDEAKNKLPAMKIDRCLMPVVRFVYYGGRRGSEFYAQFLEGNNGCAVRFF